MTDSTRSSGARRTLVLLLSLNLLCYIDRYILAAVEPQIRESFFANDPNALAKTGSLATAFLFSYMILAPIFGFLADRMSRWIIIAFGVAVWSLATAGSGWAVTFGVLLLAAFWWERARRPTALPRLRSFRTCIRSSAAGRCWPGFSLRFL